MGLKLHLDGARFANAVAALGLTPRALTVDFLGADVLCFGGAKNGLGWEAVLFFDLAAAEFRLPLQAGRTTGVQDAVLAAQRLGKTGACCAMPLTPTIAPPCCRVAGTAGSGTDVPRQANAVFAATGNGHRGVASARVGGSTRSSAWVGARLMCAWDTRKPCTPSSPTSRLELRMVW